VRRRPGRPTGFDARAGRVVSRVEMRGRAQTWPEGRAGTFPWPRILPGIGRSWALRLAQWAALEVEPGRLLPWLPVAFGLGIAGYFAAQREPAWWAPGALAACLTLFAIAARRRAVAFPILLGLAAIAAGFLTATLRAAALGHPVLHRAAYSVAVAGFVEVREERERTDRIVIRVQSINGPRLEQQLDRVRVSVRKGTAPPVGSYVSMTARLNPPLDPLRPGGYDFARDLFFRGIGASGFVSGAIKIEPPPAAPSLSLRAASLVEGVRDAIDSRIRTAIPGDAGSIASAVITGKRDAISTAVNDAMYVSSLAHVLSISGYHMAIVAGVVFFVVRALLALAPALALRRPIKKWAAAVALVAAALYLVLSGAEVATQRSFLMTAIVLIGIMADRPALTLRTLAVAALVVMLLAPESVVHPSFQMSFAATLALVAGYAQGGVRIAPGKDSSLGARIALWGVREVVALILASLLAGTATMPYAAYHFHRLAPYGVVANLLAIPIVSAWAMPCGLLALVALPFGLDGPLWQLMGLGIDWMTTVALWVASLPGAVGRVPAFGVGALLIITAGMLVMCLLQSPLRWCGLILFAVGGLVAAATPKPEVLVAAAGDGFAVRAADGRLQVLKGRDSFVVREWLAADGDARAATDKALQEGFSCDPDGCTARLADGRLVAVARTPDAFGDDCARAVLVLTAREGPPGCRATVIDRKAWRAGGALALRRDGDRWKIEPARAPGNSRPWASAAAGGSDQISRAPTAGHQAPRDATPRPQDLEAED
jgi:competence protein ComEC